MKSIYLNLWIWGTNSSSNLTCALKGTKKDKVYKDKKKKKNDKCSSHSGALQLKDTAVNRDWLGS